MALKDFECVQYFFDESDRIISWQIWPKLKKPEFANNPPPNQDMIDNGLFDEWGRPCWVLQDEELVKILTPASLKDMALKNLNDLSRYDLAKRLISGIESKNNPDYLELLQWISEAGL